MTLPRDVTASLARALYDARKSRTQLRHFSQAYPAMTIDDGYAIQREWVGLELADGRVVKGRKIGLTSRAMQQASQITEPDFAPLMDDMFFAAGDIPADRFIAPRVEVELAFLLGRPLAGPDTTVEQVLAATEHVTPAIEIIDARIEQFDRDTRGAAQGVRHHRRLRRECGRDPRRRSRASRTTSTCAGWARSSSATAWSRRPASPRACSTTRPPA